MRNKLFKSMIVILIIIFPALFSYATAQQKQGESRDAGFNYNQAEVAQAMEAGNKLYIAYLKGPTTDVRVEKERAKIDDFCEFQYNAYVVGRSTYFIAESPPSGGIVFGRHYRVTEAGFTKSTISCFTIPPPNIYAVAHITTHLLSDAPTEFHVFLSLKHHEIPIYVMTKIGVWKVEQGKITFVKKQALPESPDKTSGSHVPLWKQRLVLWPNHYETNKPWRTDSRLKGHFKEGFPDDLSVAFFNFDKTKRSEIIWVRVISYDLSCDLFLGILLNEPYHMSDPSEGDIIVFRFDPKIQRPIAIAENNSYRLSARPVTSDPKFLDTVLDGVRAYRQGRFGHNMPKIEKGIEILSSAVANIPPRASTEERFAAHFALARCFAEKYETKAAIEQFKIAVTIDPENVDAQMGLLAELTLMVHKRIDKPWPTDQHQWDKAFLDQLSTVKSNFGAMEQVEKAIHYIFKEPDSNELSSFTKEDLERGHKFGFATIRWKMK